MVASCQKTSNGIIDPLPTTNATQLNFIGNDTIDIGKYMNRQPPGPTLTDSFQVTLDPTAGFSFLDVSVSNDSGNILFDTSFSNLHGDIVSGGLSFNPSSVYVGDLNYTFTPHSVDGSSGSYLTGVVRLVNLSADNPPLITSVAAPDSIESGNISLVLTASVQDPYGLTDIKKVYFNVTKPDGTPSTGNPFEMFDDGGASGGGDVDQKAGDGVYTLGIDLSTSNPLGVYIFTFYAVSRSGITSAPFAHSIRIYQ